MSPARIAYHALCIQVNIAVAVGLLIVARGDKGADRWIDLAVFVFLVLSTASNLGALRRAES